MNKYKFTAAIAASALTLGTLPAAFVANAAPPLEEAVAFPDSGRYIADIPSADGTTMTMAITVDGDDVAAYATDGTTDEAYFTGVEQDGAIDLTSTYQDQLTASFDGTTLDGTLTMNDVARPFEASAVTAPAGLYTSVVGDTRATWVVLPDQTMTGMQDTMPGRDGELVGELTEGQPGFEDQVRQLRLDRQLEPAPTMTYGTWAVELDGTPMTAVPVAGNTTF